MNCCNKCKYCLLPIIDDEHLVCQEYYEFIYEEMIRNLEHRLLIMYVGRFRSTKIE